jgi:hypothetical protein
MRVVIKEGVIIGEINARLFHVCITVSTVFEEYGITPVLTSGCEGKHMDGSLHYKFLAWDFRLWILKEPDRLPATNKIREILNVRQDDYDVVWEEKEVLDANGNKAKTVWLHIEYDPKGEK